MNLVVSCEYGLESIVIEELNEFGYHGEQIVPSRILISNATESDIYHLNIAVRTIHRVFVLLGDFNCTSMDEIIQAARSVDYSFWMDDSQTFGIRGLREGSQDFGSMDIAREVGTVVVEYFKTKTGRRIQVNLDDPDVEIMAHLSGDRLLLLIATSSQSIHRRIERPYQHFASLKPSIAAALLRKSSWKSYKSVLDPMAGSGVIPIDAAMQARQMAPGLFANHEMFRFNRLQFLNYENFLNILELYKAKALPSNDIDIRSADRYEKSVAGMQQNISQFGLDDEIRIHQGDAENLNYISKGEISCIVTNPPYGMRIANPGVVKALYKNFARACAEKEINEIVAVTPRRHHWIVSFTSQGYKLNFLQRFYFGRLNVFMLRLVVGGNDNKETTDFSRVTP